MIHSPSKKLESFQKAIYCAARKSGFTESKRDWISMMIELALIAYKTKRRVNDRGDKLFRLIYRVYLRYLRNKLEQTVDTEQRKKIFLHMVLSTEM